MNHMNHINQIRQGDIPLFRSEIPAEATTIKDGKIAEGEGVGHIHRVVGGQVFAKDGRIFVRSTGCAKIMHTKRMSDTRAEHHPITIPAGEWEVAREMDYDPYAKVIIEQCD